MVVSLHIFIAALSIMLATYSFVKTSNKSLIISYASVILTVVSGFYLVWSEPARMLHTCFAGSIYLAFVSAMLMAAKWRRVHMRNNETS